MPKKVNFIKLGSRSINLKEIKEYSICTTREFRTLPDGTRGVNEGWGLMIWLYNENCYRTIGCGTQEEAEKLQEKLDSVLGIIVQRSIYANGRWKENLKTVFYGLLVYESRK